MSDASGRFSTKKLVNKFEKLIVANEEAFESVLPSLRSSLGLAKFELQWFDKSSKTIVGWIQKLSDEENSENDMESTKDETKPGEDTAEDTTAYRLPETIVPQKYSIDFVPYIIPGNFTFDGVVKITAQVKKDTDRIVFHASQFLINDITVKLGSRVIDVTDQTVNAKYDFVDILLGSRLLAGAEINIEVSYRGVLNKEMRGFYRSSYVDSAGEQRLVETL